METFTHLVNNFCIFWVVIHNCVVIVSINHSTTIRCHLIQTPSFIILSSYWEVINIGIRLLTISDVTFQIYKPFKCQTTNLLNHFQFEGLHGTKTLLVISLLSLFLWSLTIHRTYHILDRLMALMVYYKASGWQPDIKSMQGITGWCTKSLINKVIWNLNLNLAL